MAAPTNRIKIRTVSECSGGTDVTECELLQELGLLMEIYINELNVVYDDSGIPTEISVVLHPATADNVDEQYVCLTLNMKLPEQYPDSLPEITIRNSRGISDEHLTSLDAKLKQLAEERQGGAMLYELIEVAKESLTNNNTPSCQCVICLHGFTESDVFTKTPCYHYFHSLCLARYLKHAQQSEEKPVCAVCREPVAYDLSQLDNAPAPSANHEVYTPDAELRKMQRRMAALYRRQKEKGGIIDIEAESNKFLIDISQTPTLPLHTGITAVTAPPQNLPERNPKMQDVDPSKTEQTKEEMKPARGSTPPIGRKDVGAGKGSYSDRPRSSNRSDHRPGGRGSAQGRWSRGRGHTRPHSSGNKEYYTSPTDGGRRDMLQRSRGKGSSECQNTTDQSQISTGSKKVADQSDGRFENDSEMPLDVKARDENHEEGKPSRRRNYRRGKENERKNDASAEKMDKTNQDLEEIKSEGQKSWAQSIERRKNKEKLNQDAKAMVDGHCTEPLGQKEKSAFNKDLRQRKDGSASKLPEDGTADQSAQLANVKNEEQTEVDTFEPRKTSGRRRRAKSSKEKVDGDCNIGVEDQSNDGGIKSRDNRTENTKEHKQEPRPRYFNQSKGGSHRSQKEGSGIQQRPDHLGQSNDRSQNNSQNHSKDPTQSKGRSYQQRSEQLSHSNSLSQSQSKGRGKPCSEHLNQSQGMSQSIKGSSSSSHSKELSYSKGGGGRSKGKTRCDPMNEPLGSEVKTEHQKASSNESASSTSNKKPVKKLPPGFETVIDQKKDLGQRTVAPPPGFENVKF